MTLHEHHRAGKPDERANRLSLHALLLAAGRSTRFGGSKLQAMYGDRPLLAYPLALIASAREQGLIDGGHVVIAADDETSYRMVRDLKLDPVMNSAPDQGLSYSLRLGLTALEENGGPAAALILLGDQPLVRLDVVKALIAAWSLGAEPIVRPRYEAQPNVPGHPVLVGRSVWPQIRSLKGDAGFASLGSQAGETLVGVTGQNPDVDTLTDLRALEILRR